MFWQVENPRVFKISKHWQLVRCGKLRVMLRHDVVSIRSGKTLPALHVQIIQELKLQATLWAKFPDNRDRKRSERRLVRHLLEDFYTSVERIRQKDPNLFI